MSRCTMGLRHCQGVSSPKNPQQARSITEWKERHVCDTGPEAGNKRICCSENRASLGGRLGGVILDGQEAIVTEEKRG